MDGHVHQLDALLRKTGLRAIHNLAGDMEAIDGRSHYAEIVQVIFRREIA